VVTLREGDPVAAGAVVAMLTPVLAPMVDERTLGEQQVRVEIAEAQVKHVDARIERAKVALLQANTDVLRTEQLARQGFVAPTKLDTDRLTTLAAQKELDAAHAERHVAEHEVEQARTALMTVRSTNRGAPRSFALRAPVAGRVLRIAQTSEATVALGAPVLELGDTQALEVVAELLTADALQAKPGRRVLIERWGGDGALEGRVRLVEPAAFTKISALGVEEQRGQGADRHHKPARATARTRRWLSGGCPHPDAAGRGCSQGSRQCRVSAASGDGRSRPADGRLPGG
jgi:HlyD family secretion protein